MTWYGVEGGEARHLSEPADLEYHAPTSFGIDWVAVFALSSKEAVDMALHYEQLPVSTRPGAVRRQAHALLDRGPRDPMHASIKRWVKSQKR